MRVRITLQGDAWLLFFHGASMENVSREAENVIRPGGDAGLAADDPLTETQVTRQVSRQLLVLTWRLDHQPGNAS